MMITVIFSVGIYYLWSIFLRYNENVGIALGVFTAILVSAFFTWIKKR